VTVLAYPGDVRGVVTWVNLTGVWHFDETLNLYADDRRLLLESPTGFARGVLTGLTIEGVDEAGTSFARSPQVAWETAFRRELRHFHSCIAAGAECKTPLASAGAEIGLSLEVMRCLPR
jgi:predicted dehydrogenase